jgi:hypothetical protein
MENHSINNVEIYTLPLYINSNRKATSQKAWTFPMATYIPQNHVYAIFHSQKHA